MAHHPYHWSTCAPGRTSLIHGFTVRAMYCFQCGLLSRYPPATRAATTLPDQHPPFMVTLLPGALPLVSRALSTSPRTCLHSS